ncbi:MarR family winged helix-turn-helix transcriptional regulator [Candidatus Contubernalis alkaliaceticus]|uniref:MarR family winged helix-turn-helix transcriptional regulator n=1 Tax=Candidatus Contubernalis alkaliaceticus TaxID=338645 RepID=UPI001F4BEC6A|nr:MarR family transcriptional regulator [Candidatus Contubernalis alkalaceticus]UNC92021.1 MarR family transcriptional regulator [Candidatus Contubernalis alkalaceticus]
MKTQEIRQFRELILQLHRNLGGQLKNDAKCCGITVAQCHALMKVGTKKEISLIDLAGILQLDNSTLSRTIDGMVQLGLVMRHVNPEDRRYVIVSLTTKGHSIYNSIDSFFNEYFSSVFDLIPKEKHGQVLESFYLFAEAVDKLGSLVCCKEEFTIE